MRMTVPLPNWRSICVSAPCRAVSRALTPAVSVAWLLIWACSSYEVGACEARWGAGQKTTPSCAGIVPSSPRFSHRSPPAAAAPPAGARARSRPPSRPRTTPAARSAPGRAAARAPEIRRRALPRRGSRPLTRTPGTTCRPRRTIARRRRRKLPPRSPAPDSGEPSGGREREGQVVERHVERRDRPPRAPGHARPPARAGSARSAARRWRAPRSARAGSRAAAGRPRRNANSRRIPQREGSPPTTACPTPGTTTRCAPQRGRHARRAGRRRAQVLAALEDERRDRGVGAAGRRRRGRLGPAQAEVDLVGLRLLVGEREERAGPERRRLLAGALRRARANGAPRGHGSGVSSHTVA